MIIHIGAIGMDLEKNIVENDEAPIRLNGHHIWEKVRHLLKIIEIEKSIRLPGFGVKYSWIKQSIF